MRSSSPCSCPDRNWRNSVAKPRPSKPRSPANSPSPEQSPKAITRLSTSRRSIRSAVLWTSNTGCATNTAREAEYFSARLSRLSAGDVALSRATAAEFWTMIMGEHADFIAHLLDPSERKLVAQALQTSTDFYKLHGQKPVPNDKVIKSVD